MPAKTEMSAQEWFLSFTVCSIQCDNAATEQGLTCELTDIVVIFCFLNVLQWREESVGWFLGS